MSWHVLKKPGRFCSCGQNTTNNSDSNAINGCVSLYLKYKQVYIHKVDLTNARAHIYIYFLDVSKYNADKRKMCYCPCKE